MKILYVATIGGFMSFFKSLIRELLDEGHEIDIATNMSQYPLPEYYKEWGCGIYQISCLRSPLNKGNVDAVCELKKIVSVNYYDIVHCHTPIAAACTRIACRKSRKIGTQVIYTAHGFHFYEGAPLRNWLLFYPIEKICSRWTDVLITINKEDYERARRKFSIKKIEYVPGVGIDVKKFLDDPTDKCEKRRQLEIPEKAFVLLSVGELNINKNHQAVIKALGAIKRNNIHYVIAGKGDQGNYLESLASDYGIKKNLHAIGYRSDMPSLYKMADAYILPSIREGLNVSLMEAMASGLPCLAGKIRGNVDLVDRDGGFLFEPQNISEIRYTIQKIIDSDDRERMGFYNQQKIRKFDLHAVISSMKKIYNINSSSLY